MCTQVNSRPGKMTWRGRERSLPWTHLLPQALLVLGRHPAGLHGPDPVVSVHLHYRLAIAIGTADEDPPGPRELAELEFSSDLFPSDSNENFVEKPRPTRETFCHSGDRT